MSQQNLPDLFQKYYNSELMEAEAIMTGEEQNKRKRKEEKKEATGMKEGDKEVESLSSGGSSKKQKSEEAKVPQGTKTGNTVIDPEEDSESESESEGEWETVKTEGKIKYPEGSLQTLVNNRFPTTYLSGRFNLLIKHKLPVTAEKQMTKTMVIINKVLEQIKEEVATMFKWKGKPVIVPWQDEEIYSNRVLETFAYLDFHEKKEFRTRKAQVYLKELVHKWSFLPRSATVKETGEATKYFQVQVAWLFDESQVVKPSLRLWYGTVQSTSDSIEGASIRLSNTQSKDPVTAIQFLNSAINISGTWDDMGHADCIQDLKLMVQKVLGEEIEIGIASRKFDGGKYSDKTPNVITVECDLKYVQRVQKELVSIFSKIESSKSNPEAKTKRDRILQGIWTNWVAVPTMSSIATRSDVSKRSLYAQMEVQEKVYRSNLNSYKVQGVRLENLDRAAPESFYLSAEMLLQMENEIIEKGDTPIRHLIYDATFEETKKEIIQKRIPQESSEQEIKELIKELKGEIKWKEVLEELATKGVKVPHASLPIPKPSKLSLRAKLLGLRSRKHTDENVLVFESVTVTDAGELLLTFKNHCQEEAQVIGELLPLFIKHEMEIDPIFFCSPDLLQKAQEGYYNPLVRMGYSGLMKNVFESGDGPTKKAALPEFCNNLSAAELVKVLKCPGFSSLPLVADLGEDDLASLANTIATSPNPKPLPEGGMSSLERMLKESKLIDTTQRQEDMSDMSGSSFDSTSSFNRFQIQERAKLLAKQIQKKEAIDKMMKEAKKSNLSKKEVEMYCKIGEFTREDVASFYPDEVNLVWPVLEVEEQMEIEESEQELDDEANNSYKEPLTEEEEMDEADSYNSEDTEKRGGSPKRVAGSPNTGKKK